MVGVEELKSVFVDYKLDIDTITNGRQNVTIFDSADDRIKLDCTFSDNHLSEVYFLNNQFYELDEDALLDVVRDIVKGNYVIKTSFFKKSRWIVTLSQNISPERTLKPDLDSYINLPVIFNKVVNNSR